MTVCSGSAVAASNLRCLANAPAAQWTADQLAPKAGDLLLIRVPTTQYTPNSPNGTIYNYISGASIALDYLKKANTSFLGGTQYIQFDIAQNRIVGLPLASLPPPPNSSYTSGVGPSVILRLDANGNIVSAGIASVGSPVAYTCWNSVKPFL